MTPLLTIHQAVAKAIDTGLIEFTAHAYAEPGYSKDGASHLPILFANWNEKTHYDRETGKFVTDDSSPARLAKLAEKAGYSLEWSDEWATCEECGKAVRTQADSYSWQRSYHEPEDGGIVCIECVQDDPADYLDTLEGNPRRAVTIDLDLSAHGYRKVNAESYEHGWYPGQHDSPEVIAKSLRARGISRFLFRLDGVGQFDARFSVFVHDDEWALLGDEKPASALPYEPDVELGKALRGEPSVAYTMTTRQLTPEEFVSGSWVKDRK